MSISYDVFTGAFLSKISDFDFIDMPDENRTFIVDSFMKRAVAGFKNICKYDLTSNSDDFNRLYDIDINIEDEDEIIDIISEGMVVQWLKPFVYQQENLQNVLNTKDFTTYSPAELLMRIGNAYNKAQKDYTQMIREYSYTHGNLKELHI